MNSNTLNNGKVYLMVNHIKKQISKSNQYSSLGGWICLGGYHGIKSKKNLQQCDNDYAEWIAKGYSVFDFDFEANGIIPQT